MTQAANWVGSAWPVGLLLAFAVVLRGVPERARAEPPATDCERVPASDLGGLERCVALHPNDVGLLADLGAVYEAAGQRDRAEPLYRRALAMDPMDGDVHVRLGNLLLARGDPAAARAEGDAAVKLLVGSPAAARLVERASAPAGHGEAR